MHEESIYLTVSPRDERRLLREKSARRTLGRAIGGLSSGARKLDDVPFDPKAEDGDGDGEVQDNTRWARPATPDIPDISQPDYKGQHSAPNKEDGAPLHDLTKVYPEDIYTPNGRSYYSTGEDRIDNQAFELINEMKGKPNALVTIYRAVPISSIRRIDEIEKQKKYIQKYGAIPPNVRTSITDRSEYYDLISDELLELQGKKNDDRFSINPGDWVTPFRSYAVEHGQSHLGGEGKYEIVKRKVRARDIYTAGDSWAEWGYDPEDESVERGLASGSKGPTVKKVTESPKAYTMWEHMNDIRNRGGEVGEEEELSAAAIDGLVEHVIARLVGPQIQPIQGVDEIFETLEIYLEVDFNDTSPEVALSKAIKKFNETFGTNHTKTSLIVGAISSSNSLIPDLDDDERNRVISSLDNAELLKIHQAADYSYGDTNYLTGRPIRFDGPSWLKDMTPKQISKLVTPSTEDELVNMLLDYHFGPDGVENANRLAEQRDAGITLSQSDSDELDNFLMAMTLIEVVRDRDEFTSTKIGALRKNIELALSSSKDFLKLVHLVGMPPIAAVNKPGFFDDGNLQNSKTTWGIFYGTANMLFIHDELLNLAISKPSDWDKEIPITRVLSGFPLKNGGAVQGMLDAVVDTLIHEWGHYLWRTLARYFGVKNGSYALENHIKDNKDNVKLLDNLSPQQKNELLSILKLFDFGKGPDISSSGGDGGVFGLTNVANMGAANMPVSMTLTKGRTAAEKLQRLNLYNDGQIFSQQLKTLHQKWAGAKGLTDKNRAEDAFENFVDQIANSSNIFASTVYGASMPQEAFAELIKDYLSPVHSISRQQIISQGSMDVLDKIFELINLIKKK